VSDESVYFTPDADKDSVVYFARGERTDLIKIGFSRQHSKRLASLSGEGGQRMTLLLTVKGGRDEEAYFHRRFNKSWEHGEWFREEGVLLAYLKKRGKDSKKLAALRAEAVAKQTALAREQNRIAALCTKPSDDVRIWGYARVSTTEQSVGMQEAALQKAGVHHIFSEKVSAVNAKRPQFALLLKACARGDTVVVYSFSRLSRDLKQLLMLIDQFKADGIKLISTSEPHIDPLTTNGRLLISVTGAVDENERRRTRDRTVDGLAEKRRQGMYLGAPRKVEAKDVAEMKRLRKTTKVQQIAKKFGVSVPTVYAYTKTAKK
jgi:DNA invertase Pin-like site-specific DNA recombinase